MQHITTTMIRIMSSNKNTTPAHPQDPDGEDVRVSSESPKGPIPLTDDIGSDNGSIMDERSGLITQTNPMHPAAAGPTTSTTNTSTNSSRRFLNGRRTSLDGNNFRSSLKTIDSRTSSLDIYDDDADSILRGSVQSSMQSRISNNLCMRREFKLQHSMDDSSTNSLMVSFSKLNCQELSNLRKWNRRMQRTEVFDKYYFPAKWEANEMEALVGFLKLEDPSSKVGGGMRGGSRRRSGNKKGKRSTLGDSSVLRGGRKAGNMSCSWQSGDPNASFDGGGLSSSLTLTLKSAGKLSKLLVSIARFLNIICKGGKTNSILFPPY